MSSDGRRDGRTRAALAAGVFLFFLASRAAVAPFQRYDAYYLLDGELASCIEPWQLFTGKPLDGGDTSLLPVLLFGASHLLFGFGIPSAQVPTIVLGALAMAFFFLAWARAFGTRGALVSLAFVGVGFPHVWHTILPTVISSGVWTIGPLLYGLTFPPSRSRLVGLALLAALVPFTYPGAVLTFAALLVARFAWLRDDWTWRPLGGAAAALTAGGAAALLVRRAVQPESHVLQLGMDRLALPTLDAALASALAMLRDLFVGARSWYALTGFEPFVGWPLATLLLATGLWLGVAGARGRIGRGERWALVLFTAFALSLLLASANPRFPGVRRILPATVLLVGCVGLLVERARAAPAWARAALALWVGAALGHEVVSSVERAHTWWDLDGRTRPRPLMRATADLLRSSERVEALVFHPSPGARIDGVLCALHLDRDLRRRFGRAYVMHLEHGRPVLLEDGRRRVDWIPELAPGVRLPLLTDQPVPEEALAVFAPLEAFEVHVVGR